MGRALPWTILLLGGWLWAQGAEPVVVLDDTVEETVAVVVDTVEVPVEAEEVTDTSPPSPAPDTAPEVVPVESEAVVVPVEEATVPVPEEETVPVPVDEAPVPLPDETAAPPASAPVPLTPPPGGEDLGLEGMMEEVFRPEVLVIPGLEIEMDAGFSRIFYSPVPLSRVFVGNDTIIQAVLVSPEEVLVIPQGVGVSNLILETTERERFEFQIRVRTAQARKRSRRSISLQVYVIEIRRQASDQYGIKWTTGGDIFAPEVMEVPALWRPSEEEQKLYSIRELGPIYRLTPFTVKAILETARGESRLLAAPTLVALEGDSSQFHVGGEILIPTVSGLGSGRVERIRYGMKLSFLPTIDVDQSIVLRVNIEVSQPDFTQRVQDVPGLRTRRASAVLRARSGEVIGLGGLLLRQDQVVSTGLPLLSSLPLVGHLFKRTLSMSEYSDIVVLVVPTLLPRSRSMVRVWERLRVRNLEMPIREVNGEVFVPLVDLVRALGGKVEEKEATLVATYGGNRVLFDLEGQTLQVGSEVRGTRIENYFGIWQVPLRDVEGLFGDRVVFLWDRGQNILHVLKGIPKP